MNVTLQSLEAAGHADAEAVFKAVCAAGGFGDVDPTHGGGLDISGLTGKVKADVEAIIASPAKDKKGKDE